MVKEERHRGYIFALHFSVKLKIYLLSVVVNVLRK